MSDFAGMEELLQDFLTEAGDLLSGVDNKLVELERNPSDKGLLNEIFRGFHTIKGGAGFLAANELVTLCHLTENLFDNLRNDKLSLSQRIMDVILEATAEVRRMFDELTGLRQPSAAPASMIETLKSAIEGKLSHEAPAEPSTQPAAPATGQPDWTGLYRAVSPATPVAAPAAPASPAPPKRAAPAPARADAGRDGSIRVDTARLDQVLNLSGEIGLAKNRLNALRTEILAGKNDSDTLYALDVAVSQLDLLVSDLQNAVMKTRMQPIGRLFQKYPRITRELARSLGKDVELVTIGEETEIDKTMLEELSDPIIHLIRNAVDHGIEPAEDRARALKPEKSVVRLEARQDGENIVIIVSDDGRGMSAEKLKEKALQKRLITEEEAAALDDAQCFNLIFMPGFSTAEKVSNVSGRGVGMDVVKTNIKRLNGDIEIQSELGKGTTIVIRLPLTLAILPVLLVLLEDQPFAVPLSLVREILPISAESIQDVGGKATMIVRGEMIPVLPLSSLLGWPLLGSARYGVLMQVGGTSFVLAIDSFAGRDDAVIKSLEDFRPKGVSGVTTLADGNIVLILDMAELTASGLAKGISREALLAMQGH